MRFNSKILKKVLAKTSQEDWLKVIKEELGEKYALEWGDTPLTIQIKLSCTPSVSWLEGL